MRACLSKEELASFALGTGAHHAELATHVEACEQCRSAARSLERTLAMGTLPESAADDRASSSLQELGFVEADPAHYAIARELALGGMGRIRVAHDRRLGRMVAIKEVLAGNR